MRKLLILTFIAAFGINVSKAQTGIGTTTPDPSAKLDVTSTNKGFLPPRVTLTGFMDNSTIPSPATGLLVYNTGSNANLAAGYYYWNGSAWATIATAGGSGSFAASFMRGSQTTSQTINVNEAVKFSNIDISSGSNISLNTTSGKLTLTAGNTYRLIASMPGFSGARPSFSWYNETSGANLGSTANAYSPTDAAGNGTFGGIAEVIFTPSVTSVVYLKLLSVNNSTTSGSITTGNGDFPAGSVYPWFEAQVISGNAPVTGQSVDYAIASLSSNQSFSSAGNILFNSIQGTGITLTNGGFNLLANKTYKLEASVGGSADGYIYYTWVNSSNTIIGNSSVGCVMKAGGSYSDGPQDKAVAIYTPTTNTTVYLRVYNISGAFTAYAPSTSVNYSSTWATVSQIGSSAIVNPWVLSGNDVYNTTGKVGIGNNAPASTLDVSGSLAVSGATNLKNTLNVGTGVGLEGGEIDLVTAASGNTSLTNGTVAVDVYGDKLRIFENGGNARGVFIDLGKAPNAVGGELLWKVNSTIQPSITIGATTTAPTLGTRSINQISYRLNGDKYRLTYKLGAAAGTNHGSGDYLFTLPTGLTFNTTSGYNPIYTGVALWSSNIAPMAQYFIPVTGGLVISGVWTMQMQIVPYNSTQFRVAVAANTGAYAFWSNSFFAIAQDMMWNAEFEIWAQ